MARTGKTYAPLGTDGLVPDQHLPASVGGATAWTDITGKPSTFPSSSHTHAESEVVNLVTDLAAKQPLDADLTAIAALDASTAGAIASDGAGWIKKTYSQFKTALSLTKSDVGLGSVDNTSDVGKPVSTAQQAALDGKQPLDADLTTIAALTATTDNFMVAASSAWASRTPTQAKTSLALVKGDVGLGSVDNTADASKPVSTAQQTALNLKEATANKGIANGYASLDANTLLPAAQLPLLAASTRVTAIDFSLPQDTSAIVAADFEIGSGTVTEIGSNAILEVT